MTNDPIMDFSQYKAAVAVIMYEFRADTLFLRCHSRLITQYIIA